MRRWMPPLLILAVLAAAAALWRLDRRPGSSSEDWEAMQEAVGARADPSASIPVESPPSLRRRAAEDPPFQPPAAAPPGGPLAAGEQDRLPALGQSDYDVQLLVYVERLLDRDEVDAVAVAERYLQGPIPSERVAGAVILAALGILDADTIVALAAEKDPTVPLNVLGWLEDSGDVLSAEMMVNALAGEGWDVVHLMDSVSAPSLSPSGRRALIALAAGSPDEEGAVSQGLLQVAASPEQPLDVRAKAAAELRGLLDPEALTRELAGATSLTSRAPAPKGAKPSASAAVDHPAWAPLRERLTRDLKAPPGLAPAMNEMTLFDLQEWTASGPLLIQTIEMASRIEQVLRDPEARVEPGVAAALAGYVAEAEQDQALSPGAQVALRRIKSRLAVLAAAEAAGEGYAFDLDAPP